MAPTRLSRLRAAPHPSLAGSREVQRGPDLMPSEGIGETKASSPMTNWIGCLRQHVGRLHGTLGCPLWV